MKKVIILIFTVFGILTSIPFAFAVDYTNEIDNNVNRYQDLYFNFEIQGLVSLNDLRSDNNVLVSESLNFGYDGASQFILYSNNIVIDFWYTVENFVVAQPHVFYYGGFSGLPQIYHEHIFKYGVLYAFDYNMGYITAFDSDLVELFSYSFDNTDTFISFSFLASDFIDYQDAYDEGYDIGYQDGYQDGVEDGPSAQYNRGYEVGQRKGLFDGYILGYNDGVSVGIRDGQNQSREYYGIFYNSQWLTAEQWGDIRYGDGYDKGLRTEIDWWSWSMTFFLMPFRILNIQILPGIRIGYFALFSLLLGVVGWFFFIVGKGGGKRK